MFAKAVLALCAQALLVQSVFSQCLGRAGFGADYLAAPYGLGARGLTNPFRPAPYSYDGLGRALAYDGLYPVMDFTPTSGGGLAVTSVSAIPPTGISIISENAFEGIVAVSGELPFVGSTAVDGLLPTLGTGAINHGCGNGLNFMTALSTTSTPASIATASIPAPILPAFGAPAFGAPAFPAPAFTAPAFAAPAFAAPAFAAPAFAAPAFAAPALAPALAYDGYLDPYGYDALDAIEITPTTGGALPVSSASAIPPTGISIASETAYEGPLACAGELPFVGTVAMEGVLPTAGAGAVNHACGNGVNAMTSEPAAFGPGYPGAYPGFGPGYGYPNGFYGEYGYGCAV